MQPNQAGVDHKASTRGDKSNAIRGQVCKRLYSSVDNSILVMFVLNSGCTLFEYQVSRTHLPQWPSQHQCGRHMHTHSGCSSAYGHRHALWTVAAWSEMANIFARTAAWQLQLILTFTTAMQSFKCSSSWQHTRASQQQWLHHLGQVATSTAVATKSHSCLRKALTRSRLV